MHSQHHPSFEFIHPRSGGRRLCHGRRIQILPMMLIDRFDRPNSLPQGHSIPSIKAHHTVNSTPPSSDWTSVPSVAFHPLPKILSIRFSRSQTTSESPFSSTRLKYLIRCWGIHSSSVVSAIQLRAGISLMPAKRSRYPTRYFELSRLPSHCKRLNTSVTHQWSVPGS